MTLKPLLVALLALGGLASGQASANYSCTLGFVSPSGTNPVHVGQQFGFSVLVSFVDFGPYPPITIKPFEVHFHGTRNGVWDTGSGQHLANVAGNYEETIMSYNPGGVAGNYIRYARNLPEGPLSYAEVVSAVADLCATLLTIPEEDWLPPGDW